MKSKSAIKTAFAIGYSINLLKINFHTENSSKLSQSNRHKSELIFLILSEIKREFKYQFGYEIASSQPSESGYDIEGIDNRLQNEFNGYLQVAYLLGGLIAASTVTYPNIQDETKFTLILHDFLSELETFVPQFNLKNISASLNSSSKVIRCKAKEDLLQKVFEDNSIESPSVICHIAEEAMEM